MWLQGVTVSWMLIECGVALFAAWRAHSPALLAFGSDSLVEVLSAAVVLLQFVPRLTIPEAQATRAAALLLFALAAIVTLIAASSLLGKVLPDESTLGIGVTATALLIRPRPFATPGTKPGTFADCGADGGWLSYLFSVVSAEGIEPSTY